MIVQGMREHLRMLCDRYVWLCVQQISSTAISLTFRFSLTRQTLSGNVNPCNDVVYFLKVNTLFVYLYYECKWRNSFVKPIEECVYPSTNSLPIHLTETPGTSTVYFLTICSRFRLDKDLGQVGVTLSFTNPWKCSYTELSLVPITMLSPWLWGKYSLRIKV